MPKKKQKQLKKHPKTLEKRQNQPEKNPQAPEKRQNQPENNPQAPEKNPKPFCFLGCDFKEFQSPSGLAEVLVLVFAGLFVGFVNGFLGAGGGILLVPILSFIVREPTKVAHATAVVVILPVCLASGIVYFCRGFVEVSMSLKVLIGTIAGGVLGTFLLKKLANSWISLVFAVVMIGVGMKIVFF